MKVLKDFIPVNVPRLDGNEKEYLVECIESGWISSEGPFVSKFENRMAERVGRRHGIAVCNGSAALEAAIFALGIGRGDEVILPTFTIISCAAPVVRAGATPVLVDCDRNTWNMRAEDIALRITSRTKAIMAVHIYGLPVEMDPLLKLGEEYHIPIIEDAAEMHGQTCGGRACGSFGALSTFSFYPNKPITTGEGGMILTDEGLLAEKCRSLRNLCFGKKRFVHEELGWNFRLSNIQAALGFAQLERLDDTVAAKRRIGLLYSQLLAGVPGLELPLERTNYAENIYWVYGIVLKDEVPFDAAEVMHRLGEKGIGTRPFFWPMHEQPVFRKMGLFQGESYPVAERIARRGFYLPSGPGLSETQVEIAAGAVKEVMV